MQVNISFVLLCLGLGKVLSLPVESSSSARIVNGFEVSISEIPYHAALRRKYSAGWSYACGAVVISSRASLTAAHCIDEYVTSPTLLRIIVGTISRVSGGKTYDISYVIMHNAYSTITLEHDIGLLVTKKEIEFNERVRPIPVAPSNLVLPAGTEAIVSGYGTTSFDGTSSPVLLAAYVNIIDESVCSYAYKSIGSISSGMICAGASNPARDACRGDSGGPLVSEGYLVGLVSWGEGCAESQYPGVYTRISSYSEWIAKNIKHLTL